MNSLQEKATKNFVALNLFKYVLLILASLVIIMPIFVIFMASFKTGNEFNRTSPFKFPTFAQETEIWSGVLKLNESTNSKLVLRENVYSGHSLNTLTFVIDKVSETPATIEIKINDKSKKLIGTLDVKKDSTSVIYKVPTTEIKNLRKENILITGNNVSIRKIKTKEILGNYRTAFAQGNMLVGIVNTIIIILFAGLGTVFTGTMTAYVLNRYDFKLKKLIYTMFLWIALIPTITAQVATFQIVEGLGLYNTRLSCIILSMGTDIISIMIYMQYLDKLSVSLDESAIIDGANYWQVYYKIILPLLRPATVTVLILKCVNLYNDFYGPLLYMPKKSLMVISTSLYKFKGPFGTNWPVICAGAIIALVPTLIVFLLAQKQIYNGMSGAVKE